MLITNQKVKPDDVTYYSWFFGHILNFILLSIFIQNLLCAINQLSNYLDQDVQTFINVFSTQGVKQVSHLGISPSNNSQSCLPILIHLDLSYNKISSLQNRSLSHLTTIKFLSLKSNLLTDIEEASFMGLSCAHLNNKILSKQGRKDHLTEVLDVLCEAGVDGSKRVHELSHQQIHLQVESNALTVSHCHCHN